MLVEAEAAWTELERPLEAARCRLLAGFRLRDARPERARRSCWRAPPPSASAWASAHLAERARALEPV